MIVWRMLNFEKKFLPKMEKNNTAKNTFEE